MPLILRDSPAHNMLSIAGFRIKRQVAVTFVIAVEEPAFLIAVDGIIGRVEI